MSLASLLQSRALTLEQRTVLDVPGPLAWAVIAADGFVYVTVDKPLADRYAANTHGIVVPLWPEQTVRPNLPEAGR